MFNRTEILVTEVSRGPSHVTVKEQRAPTDESIKLYHELLEKAKAEVIELEVARGDAGNVLNHIKLTQQIDSLSLRRRVVIAFKLNGTQYKFEGGIDELDFKGKDEMARAIVQELLRIVGEGLWKELPSGTFP